MSANDRGHTAAESVVRASRVASSRRRSSVGRWIARLVAAAATAALMVAVRVQLAAASTLASSPVVGVLGAGPTGQQDQPQWTQTPGALSWIDIKDSHGISAWNYELSLDRGGTFSPGKFFWSSIVDFAWGGYRSFVLLALWFLDWVMSFSWLSVIASPLLDAGDALQDVVDRIGALPALLTVAALVAVTWMARGRWSTGIYELGMALVIAALATGVFAQPVHLLAGDNGLIMRSQQTGLQLASLLDTGPGGQASDPGTDSAPSPSGPVVVGPSTGDGSGYASVDQMRTRLTGELVDTFIRQPTETINFGQVLDGGKCESAYTDVVKAGPYGMDSDIRDKVGDCDKALGEYAANPSAAMASGSLIFMPAAAVILLLAVLVAGSVIAAACYALFLGLKAIIMLVLGVLPGGPRGGLLLTFAETAVSMVIILFTSVFLGVFLQVVQQVFRAGGVAGDAPAKTFLVVDIVLVVGVVIFWRQRKRLRESSQRLAEWMAQRPGKRREVTATRLPERTSLGLGTVAGRALSTASQISMIRSRKALNRAGSRATYNIGSLDARRQTVGIFGLGPDGEDGAGGPGVPGPGGPGGAGGPRPAVSGRTGALLQLGAHAAMAAATGGASTAMSGTMTRAITAHTSVRRARLLARMGTVAAGTGPTRGPIPAQGRPSSPIALGPDPAPAPAPRPPSRPVPPGRPAGTPPPSRTSSPPRRQGPAPRPATPRPAMARPVRPVPMTGTSRLRSAGAQTDWIKVVRDGQVIWIPRPGGGSTGGS